MKASDVPRCFRESPLLAQAFLEGQAAGERGAAPDGNPWMEKAPEYEMAVSRRGPLHIHARLRFDSRTRCGCWDLPPFYKPFDPCDPAACKRCIRAVEAERRRLETRWEQGRSSTHPK